MAVAIVLDPTEVAVSRTQVDISAFAADTVDWGDGAIEAYLAEASRGQVPVDFRVPNRIVEVPLRLRAVGATSFTTIRTQIQAKAALIQREGGWLKRTTALGDVFAEVVSATLRLGGSGPSENIRSADPDAVLTLECLPDWYQAEVDLLTTTETTAAEVRKVMTTVKGNYPNRCRIIVADGQGVAQKGIVWGIRSGNYSAASTAALAYEAEALTPLDSAAIATVSGASGGGSNNVVRHAALSASAWTPVLSTTILSGTASMTHVGTYRVWARCYSTSATPPKVQLVWDTGSLFSPVENTPALLPGASSFYALDLGEVRLNRTPVGTHLWNGQIQALGDAGGENVSIDKVWLVPVDDGYGILRMSDPTLAGAIISRDSFTATSSGGTLNGRTPEVGSGTWATSGAATDFTFLDADAISTGYPPSEAVGRSVASASLRFGIFGTVSTDQQVSAQVGAMSTTGECGVVARWVDSSNYLRFTGTWSSGTKVITTLNITKVVAGVATVLASRSVLTVNLGAYCTLKLGVTANGNVTGLVYSATGALSATLPCSDTVLATSGALDDGKAGIVDAGDGTNIVQRWYDDIVVSRPPPEAVVVNANRTAQLRNDGHFREVPAGSAYDLVNYITGDLPRLPPSGLEARSVELFVKASRGDFDQLPDAGIDDVSVQVLYSPTWLFVPES